MRRVTSLASPRCLETVRRHRTSSAFMQLWLEGRCQSSRCSDQKAHQRTRFQPYRMYANKPWCLPRTRIQHYHKWDANWPQRFPTSSLFFFLRQRTVSSRNTALYSLRDRIMYRRLYTLAARVIQEK
ncbi:hypothetical protein NDU88_004634 [Pleurodeles waltl]|uniref:Uncharacterized protein n=1 Tax=Pleurodeles waltl TaxID=8319 RepID=A0AAV7MU17_PLEWA|nr:hypothetical protein NDU88_004634 [Pleurodeles waltl]